MFDFDELDFYELLGVARNASSDEIKRAYRREISQYHPDRFAGADAQTREYAERRSQAITEAYTTLSDFSARSSYNLNRARSPRSPRPAPPPPPQQRDHQAELYDQARAHLDAGRSVQALAALRQLQQINPFYRDSADLLLRAEADLRARQAPARAPAPRRAILAGGAIGGVALIALVLWGFMPRGASTAATPPAAPGEVTAAPAPTDAPAAPTALPEATAAPTALPEATAAPTALPTVAPTASPIPAPTLANAVPTPPPAEQRGESLLSDSFDQPGWADTSGRGWGVGYDGDTYRIAVDAGVGAIWSYRTLPASDVTAAVDMLVRSGVGGLLLRFQDENNYLALVLDPQQRAYNLQQQRGGGVTVLAAGTSDAIRTGEGAQNRLAARVAGDIVQVLVNGQLLAEVEAAGAPRSPRFGLLAVSAAQPAEVVFDNLQIRTAE